MTDAVKAIKNNPDLKIVTSSLMREDFKLFSFQHKAVAMMFVVPRMILGYDVGLGKSSISIATFALLREKKKFSGVMYVVTPRSALYQWKNEVEKFSHLTATVIDAQFMDKEERDNYYTNEWGKHDVVISTYSLMYKDIIRLEPHLKNVVAVLDEVTNLKNRDSKLYKVAGKIVTQTCPYIYGLSATIMKNNLIEPYNIFKLIIPSSMPSYTKFEQNFCIMESRRVRGRIISIIGGHTNIPSFYTLIDPYYIGCKKTDINSDNLPAVAVKPVYLKMNPKQRSLYIQALEGLLEDTEEEITSSLKKLIRCQQISDSPSILSLQAESSKEEELLRLLEEDIPENEKVVIFSRFKTGVNRLESILQEYNPLSITGDKNPVEREEIKKLFQTDPKYRVILINTAAREAINLQIASNLVFYNLDWSYGNVLQIVGRINRLGSEHDINNVYVLINKGTIDEYVYQSVLVKESYFSDLLGDVGYKMSTTDMRKFINNFSEFSKALIRQG